MCIICAKPANIALPSWELFEHCFTENPDGAGLAFPQNSKIHWKKGFSSYTAFREYLQSLIDQRGEESLKAIPMVFHFRIGTHGSKDAPEQTHPFPLCGDYEQMEALEGDADTVVFHNGVFNITGLAGTYRKDDAGHNPSDTEEFIKNIIYPISRIPSSENISDIYSEPLSLIIGELANYSRLCLLTATKEQPEFFMWGTFEHPDTGMYYSNTGYKIYPKYTWSGNQSKGYSSDAMAINNRIKSYMMVDYRSAKIYYEDQIFADNQCLGGGYDKIIEKDLRYWYSPVHIEFTNPKSKTISFLNVQDPKMHWYFSKETKELYFYNEITDKLIYRGLITKAEVLPIDEKMKCYSIPTDAYLDNFDD